MGFRVGYFALTHRCIYFLLDYHLTSELVAELVDGIQPTGSFGYVLYRTLGDLLPSAFDEDVRWAGTKMMHL